MFSRHYHMLLDDFKNKPGVGSYHMAYVANEDQDSITFLYKFVKGECP
jgi:DNA mismatch repair protein MSH6